MRSLLAIVTALALLACPATDKPETAAAGAQATDQVVVDEVHEILPARLPGAVPRADAKALSQSWVIVLDSEGIEERRRERLTKLAEVDPAAKPSRLSATEFKGLMQVKGPMPCSDVLIAADFATREKALAYSKKLTDGGVGNYPMHAGKYVGAPSAVAASCELKPERGSCGAGVFLAVQHTVDGNGRTFVHLGLEEAIQARALMGSPMPQEIDPGIWLRPLPQLELGELNKGDELVVVEESGRSTSCKIQRFVGLMRGTWHVSMEERQHRLPPLTARRFEDAPPQPVCGVPEIFGELDCIVKSPVLAHAPDVKLEAGDPWVGTHGSDAFKTGAFLSAKTAGEAHASEQGAELEVESATRTWRVGGDTIVRMSLRLLTGDGLDECGGPDFDTTVVGWGLEKGDSVEPLSPPRPAIDRSTTLIYQRDGVRHEVFRELFGDIGVSTLAGEEVCRLQKPCCDCAC